MSITDRDRFYLSQLIAPILPIAMLSTALTGLLLFAIRQLSGQSLGISNEAIVLSGDAGMIGLAWLCRQLALAGRLHLTALAVIAYGGLFSLVVVFRSDVRGDGLLVVVPALMIIILIGSLFALRAWHLLLGYAVTMAPGWWYAQTVSIEITTEGRNINSAATFTLATALTFYLLSSRLRRYLFGVLREHDERAQRDPLTGLLNRFAWQERAAAAIRRADVTGSEPVLLFVDVDHFKQINDRLGHVRGDEVLVRIASLLWLAMPADAIVSRFGGEEFVVLRDDCDLDRACEEAGRLQSTLAAEQFPGQALTISVGIACRRPGEPLDALLHRADLALLRAKTLGRDRIEIDGPESSPAPEPLPLSP